LLRDCFLIGCFFELETNQLGDPIEERQREEELRGPAVLELRYCINSFRDAAQSKDPKYDHIDAAEKAKVHSVLQSLAVFCPGSFGIVSHCSSFAGHR
jgi:hypothetical protein